MPAPTEADLIFSSEQANHNFSKTLGELKRSTLSIYNRLTSILSDAEFAQRVGAAYGRPLIANERCGSWYIDPARKGGSAYFKSTDGHQSVWKFSSRRLNLHLLGIVGANDGCIIVDSTRRGKSMPDSLSKTIPIWCSVFNRFLFPNESQYHDLYTPPRAVSESENVQITAFLPSFVKALRDLKIQPDVIRKHISKPIRPVWVTPDSHLTDVSTVFEDFHPIICCTVSRRVTGGEHSEGGYIQGAGDDTENWAHGLTPTIFWESQQTLLSTSEADLPDLIKMMIRRKAEYTNPATSLTCVKPTSYLFVTTLPPTKARPEKTVADTITITLKPEITDQSTWLASPTYLDVGVGPHKIGQRGLRAALPVIMDFVKSSLFPDIVENTSVEVSKDQDSRENLDVIARTHYTAPMTPTPSNSQPQELDESPRSPDVSAGEQEKGLESEPTNEVGLSHSRISSPLPVVDQPPKGQDPETKKIYTTLALRPRNENPYSDLVKFIDKHIIVACETGKDLSIGVGLAIVCLFFDDDGELLNGHSKRRAMNKDFIKTRLAWFSTSLPDANPSRGTLQSVNRFLMDHRRDG